MMSSAIATPIGVGVAMKPEVIWENSVGEEEDGLPQTTTTGAATVQVGRAMEESSSSAAAAAATTTTTTTITNKAAENNNNTDPVMKSFDNNGVNDRMMDNRNNDDDDDDDDDEFEEKDSISVSSDMYDGLDEYEGASGHPTGDFDYNDPAKVMQMRMEEKRMFVSSKGGAAAAAAAAGGNPALLGIFPTTTSSSSLMSTTHSTIQPLSTFKAATGCTDASDFIVSCFLARLRSGITVVKYARSRLWWCKSHLRMLHIGHDGCSLTWNNAEFASEASAATAAAAAAAASGSHVVAIQPPSKHGRNVLDLTTCKEVRHAWTPDPQNPMYTGTPILRQKCEAGNAHKSFALIFPKRTLDITACTADQCKVLIEGFSALCYRLHLHANAQQAASSNKLLNNSKRRNGKSGRSSRNGGSTADDPAADGLSTTASVTLSNNTSKLP